MILLKPNCNRGMIQVVFAILIFVSIPALSQQDNTLESHENVVASIFNEVWLPFMESYRDADIKKFKSIHAKDLARVSIDRNTIQSLSNYVPEMEGVFQKLKGMGRQMDIRFSILSSAIDESKAYQTGYYCFSTRASESDSFQPHGYGFFNVLLIKEDGKWKISTDADKQADISEEEFAESGTIYKLD